ncbi:unnamed protein product [Rotaria sp. Silwood1]|nr:unnamed protein product [Rotaria sp. Silwood1]
MEESSYFEVFDKLVGEIHIEDNGRVITHGQSVGHAVARGKGEYSSRQHRFRFRIERLGKQKWILFAIISKSVPVAIENLYGGPKSCGWGGNNSVFLNGNYQPGLNDYQTDIEVNDILELFIDCDRRKIRMTNERTQNTHELDIDITKCPFPWQVSLNLYDSDDRVRILP